MFDILGVIFSPFIYFLSYCFFKKKNVWCFGSWFGMKYTDNSKYLFEYITKHQHKYKIDAVWICGEKTLAREIQKKGYKAYSKYSLKGLWYQLTCKVFICTVNSKDFYFATLTRRNIIIQLWHGAPLKKIGYDAEESKLHAIWTRTRSFFIDNYSFIVSPSQQFDPLFCSAFGVTANKIFRAGYPRNDGLFVNKSDKEKIRKQFGATGQKRLLVYLPTHRGEGKHSHVIKEVINQFIAFDKFIKDQDLIILIKPHYYDLKEISIDKQGQVVKILKDFGEWDLYQILGAADGLITDYSSVFIDFEILKKPIYFLAPDLDWYLNQDRGMYFKYSAFAKEYCENVENLLHSLKNTDGHLSCNFKINDDKDGEYSRKVFEKLLSVI